MTHWVSRVCLATVLLSCVATGSAWSQSPIGAPNAPRAEADDTATVITAAPIYVQPTTVREPIRVAREGSVLQLLGQEGEWCNIAFQDPQYGRRVGYIETQFVRIARAGLHPLDLSIAKASISLAPDRTNSQGTVAPMPPVPLVGAGMPRKYKWWGGALVGAGAYYLLSYAVVRPDDIFCAFDSCVSTNSLRTAWLAMGSGLTAGGIGILAVGRQKGHQIAPTLSIRSGGITIGGSIKVSAPRHWWTIREAARTQ